jgi:hypothetical protein
MLRDAAANRKSATEPISLGNDEHPNSTAVRTAADKRVAAGKGHYHIWFFAV